MIRLTGRRVLRIRLASGTAAVIVPAAGGWLNFRYGRHSGWLWVI